MKNLVNVFLLVIGVFLSTPLSSQDLSSLTETAHYTLINTKEDLLGLNDTIQLVNTPFAGADGVYSNGIYGGNDPENYSQILTPRLNTLYDSVWAVQVSFKISDLEEITRPMLMLGVAYRYLGFEVLHDDNFVMRYNNSHLVPIDGLFAVEDVWYELTILHHENSNMSEFYLDGSLVGQIDSPLDRNDQDGYISNTNFASGRVFKGYWRNLRVYGSEGVTALKEILQKSDLSLSPNPSSGYLGIHYAGENGKQIAISDASGVIRYKSNLDEESNEVDISFLSSGVYFVHILNSRGVTIAVKRIVLSR